ncbi:hypothetical protein [Agrococcus sp. TSP3-2-1]|uniref:hypothetical protein n=1 Tax=Agrococcus sp. TSP3-2-1 TaxID=2804583 RepID=UPI003CF79978
MERSTAPAAAVPLQRAREIGQVVPGAQPERDASLARVRHGVYADAAALEASTDDARYVTRIQAVNAVRDRPIFARESALAAHGVPFGRPDAVYTTGDRRTAHKKAGVVHSAVELAPDDVFEVGGLRVCSLAFALAEVARRSDPLDSVSALDFALRDRRVTKQQVLDALQRQSRRGHDAAHWAIAFADGRGESVGESWSRVRIFQLGFAAPELQRRVTGPTGKEWRVDMTFERPGRRPLYGEFDGAVKYGALANQAGKSGAKALAEEKLRDDDLLFTGDPAHWVWLDVLQPSRLDALLTAHGVPRVRPALLGLASR